MELKIKYKLAFLGILVVFVAILHLFFGSIHIPFYSVFDVLLFPNSTSSAYHDVIWWVRLPRMLTALLAGAALSLAGLQMQTLFRNPLAGPDVLGLTSGAGLGVAISIFLSPLLLVIKGFNPIFAFTGAFFVMLIILPIAKMIKDNNSLLVIGIMLSAIASSCVGILQYISDANDVQSYLMWTFGKMGGLSFFEVFIIGIGLLVGLLLAFINSRQMNVWVLGESYLTNLQFNIAKARMTMILSTCLLTGVVTAYCGPIAFVGLVSPLLVRNWLKTYNHQWLIIGACLGGSICLLVCDLFINIFSSQVSIPINVATSLFGAPVVIFFIFKLKRLSI
ncbi:MAG: iron ABC transporter permease [Cyclobacteriaceae bacterium]|jgi:iron complex transport system permease protein|nr:iron ABC transporter permease [Cyclobacteriaceae bacterium]